MDYLKELVSCVSEFSGIPPKVVFSKTRKREVVVCRAVLAGCLYDRGLTLSAIGDILSKDHSTIGYLVNQFRECNSSHYPEIWGLKNQVLISMNIKHRAAQLTSDEIRKNLPGKESEAITEFLIESYKKIDDVVN